jgi:hypothetical protein
VRMRKCMRCAHARAHVCVCVCVCLCLLVCWTRACAHVFGDVWLLFHQLLLGKLVCSLYVDE